MKVAFTDGAKYEDLSKVQVSCITSWHQLTELLQVVVFVAHNIVPRDDKEGWQLLLCLRSFSYLDLLLSLEVHTEQTILAGRKELVVFWKLMKVLI